MNILITGGTGSLGQALVAKLLPLPTYQKIIVYSRDEHKQEQLKIKLKDHPKLRFFIGDIRDKERLMLALNNVDQVIHTAALKIVPTAEYNPFEAIKTNVLGTQNLIDSCIYHKDVVRKIIFVSTDKAVSPINLYGATKLCAEKLIIAANNIHGPHGPKFSVVRYGNVANSNGSVIPLFKEQIKNNQQLTITDDRMTRFYITLDEAATFVLQSLERMYGAETFVPEMPSFKIKDLALTMMENYPPEKQWCTTVGIRPGEKLHEEIITKEELNNCDHDINTKTYIINPPTYERETQKYKRILEETQGLTSNSDGKLTKEDIKEKLKAL